MGRIYYQGEGVPIDYDKAFYWYKKAADQGEAIAQKNLGLLYYYGEGVTQNEAQAKYWFRKACNNGNQEGCENLKALS